MNDGVKKFTLFIIDDNPIFREGLLKVLCGDDFEIIGCSGFEKGVCETCIGIRPGMVILDIIPFVDDAIDMIHSIKRAGEIDLLVFSECRDEEHIVRAIASGSDAYISKRVEIPHLREILFLVHSGRKVFDRSVFSHIEHSLLTLAKQHYSTAPPNQASHYLTRREKEIVDLILTGFSNKEIADALHLATGTVKNIISNMLLRFQMRSRAQLASLAYLDHERYTEHD